MIKYNVHLYREMRLAFEGIEAASPAAAAAIARDKPTEEASLIDDCEGMTLSALVDEAGDEEYERSVFIDFEAERLRKAAPKLLAACQMVADRWERGDLAEAARACSTAVAEAGGDGISPQGPEGTASVRPVVTASVRGGLIEDLDATIAMTVLIEDWDVADEDTGDRPARSVHALAGGLSGSKLAKSRRLITQE
jgi:hypothetical protein